MSVFEINDYFYAHAGCTDRENHAPGYVFICTFLYKGIHNVEKPCTLTGAQVLKSMHPAAKMCTQGAGCILNLITLHADKKNGLHSNKY